MALQRYNEMGTWFRCPRCGKDVTRLKINGYAAMCGECQELKARGVTTIEQYNDYLRKHFNYYREEASNE